MLMAKISPVSGKYIVHASIKIDGVVDRPDIIGAIFGQTEGLLGSDLELRELQRSGRIGRIEVNTQVQQGKTVGEIIIPSSLDKAETVIVAAAMEIIERIGPCNSTIHVESVEDIRITKRNQVIERAKELLRQLQDSVLPDSQEIAEKVSESVRVMEISSYGKDKLPCGPGIEEMKEIVIVEGRADVLNLLKHGFKNVVAMNGSSVPPSLVELCKSKTVTVFVDGDRGGILNVKELMAVTDIDFIARAPDGKEVEELTLKEIHKSLRAKVAPEQMKNELASKESLRQHPSRPQSNNQTNQNNGNGNGSNQSAQNPNQRRRFEDNRNGERSDRSERSSERSEREQRSERNQDRNDRDGRDTKKSFSKRAPDASETEKFTAVMEELVGSHAAALLDKELSILGKVPLSELDATLESMEGAAYAVILDGAIEKQTAVSAEKARVTFIVGKESKIKPQDFRTSIIVM